MDSRQIIKRSPSERMAVVDLESELLQSRIIFITGEIDEESVATYQAEIMYLASQITDKTKTSIKIYINSPGGSVYSCLGLYDIMQYYINKGYIIETKNIGLAASAAAIILMSGSKGKRTATKNSTIMLHQPSSGTVGTAKDMEIDIKEVLRLKEVLNGIISKHASEELVPFLERDKWMTAEEAKQYNIIDSISE